MRWPMFAQLMMIQMLAVATPTDPSSADAQIALKALEQLGSKREGDTLYLGPKVRDADFFHLRAIPGVTRISLHDTPLTDEGLRTLGDLPQLEALYLWDAPITDAGLAHLVKLERL